MRTVILEAVEAGSQICPVCDSSFSAPHRKYCGGCAIELDCPACLGSFITKRFSYAYDGMCCSRECQVKLQHKPVFCDVHGDQKADLSGLCMVCHNESVNKAVICIEHGDQEKSFGGKCIACYNSSDENRARISNRNFKIWRDNEEYRKLISSNLGAYLRKNWILESPECDTHPAEKRQALFGSEYECWGCIKDKAYQLREIELGFESAYWQPTYRYQSYSSAGQFMMEEDLIERDVGWFVYIKGYIRDEEWIPLVVGKTGSRLVQFETDISFRTEGENLGRSFLREFRTTWDTSKILIIPCESESEALDLEQEIASEHKLFFS